MTHEQFVQNRFSHGIVTMSCAYGLAIHWNRHCNVTAIAGGLRASDGKEVPIVHQYDRCDAGPSCLVHLYTRPITMMIL